MVKNQGKMKVSCPLVLLAGCCGYQRVTVHPYLMTCPRHRPNLRGHIPPLVGAMQTEKEDPTVFWCHRNIFQPSLFALSLYLSIFAIPGFHRSKFRELSSLKWNGRSTHSNEIPADQMHALNRSINLLASAAFSVSGGHSEVLPDKLFDSGLGERSLESGKGSLATIYGNQGGIAKPTHLHAILQISKGTSLGPHPSKRSLLILLSYKEKERTVLPSPVHCNTNAGCQSNPPTSLRVCM